MKNRIEYFDLAKGFCILYVVMHHLFGKHLPFFEQSTNIRMPLYFLLSGIFFKTYDGFCFFLKKKTNKLFIPFLFFYFFVSCFVPTLVWYMFGTRILGYDAEGFVDSFVELFVERHSCNGVVWFLLCLFWMNIIYYFINYFSDFFNYKEVTKLVLSLLVGVFGLYLGYKRIAIPFFIDSSISAIPFFAAGSLLYRNTSIFVTDEKSNIKTIILASLFLMVVILCGPFVSYYRNQSDDYYKVYLFGILGGLSVILYSKVIKTLPWISYFGRYSIVILCTHSLYIKLVLDIAGFFGFHLNLAIKCLEFVFLMFLYRYTISFFIKYCPHVFAQKDVL